VHHLVPVKAFGVKAFWLPKISSKSTLSARGLGMRKCALVAILSAGMVACCGVFANACGDKLLVLGRGIRLEALLGNRTAKILAYQHAGTHGAELIADPEFQSALKNAGYQLRIVRDTEELEVALRLGKYDLLLSDIADTDAVEPTLQSALTAPALIPILYQPAKANLALAEKRYHYVLKAPRKVGRNVSVIEQALETKLQAEAKLKRERRKPSGSS
jgi:hypothetical protein